MNLVEYHVLVPMFADPKTAFEKKPASVRKRLRGALRRHLLEAVILRAETIAPPSTPYPPSFSDHELEMFLGQTIAAWCSDELRWRILDEALQLRIANESDRAVELPKECYGADGIDERLVCALAHYDLLAGYTGPDHSQCAFPKALSTIARTTQRSECTPPFSATDDPYHAAMSHTCDVDTANVGTIRLRRLALLTHRFVWGHLERRRKQFGNAHCFLSTTPVDGCYFRKVEEGRGTWDLLLGVVLYVSDEWQDAFDRYLTRDAQYDLVQDALYYHKNGLPFMPQL